jgi:hypothetical protein
MLHDNRNTAIFRGRSLIKPLPIPADKRTMQLCVGPRRHRRGMAMMMVLLFTAMAAVMAYAILGSSLSEERIASSEIPAAQADVAAESGADLAAYYLEYPIQAPAITPQSGSVPMYWAGTNGITFSGLGNQKANVTVSPTGTTGTSWAITSTGYYDYGNGTTLSHTITSSLTTTNGFVVRQALASNSALNLSNSGASTVIANSSGPALVTNSTMTRGSGLSLSGGVTASGYSGNTLAPVSVNPVPPYSSIYAYGGGSGYTLNGILYTAESLLNWILGLLFGSPNPANVLSLTSNYTFSSNQTITGTVYCTGNLTISGNVTITPAQAGFPALVVLGTTTLSGNGSLTINGLFYSGKGLTSGSSTSKLTVKGALLIDQGGISSSFDSQVNVTYKSQYLNFNPSGETVPQFTSDNDYLTPITMKMSSWSQ